MNVVIQKFHEKKDKTGALTFLEQKKDIQFEIKRIYYIYGVGAGERRGFHAHKELEQYLVCVSGECKVLLDDSEGKTVVSLKTPTEGLYVGPGVWHEMFDFAAGTVLLVLASDYYNESDYIRNYGDFLDYMRGMKK